MNSWQTPEEKFLQTGRLDHYPHIHISDQIQFLRCRRKWDLGSRARRNLRPTSENARAALWFGTGFHFVMEDYHGYKKFPDMISAYYAYKKATDQNKLPIEIESLDQLAEGMLTHYEHFLSQRTETLQTVWVNGVPQVEVRFSLPTNIRDEYGDPIMYDGTLDRVVRDEHNMYWVVDYKTAKSFNTSKLDLDQQVSRYAWVGKKVYGVDFAGCIWQTHKKSVPYEPEELKRGGLSVNKQQDTTHFLYRRALQRMYPSGDWRSESKYMEMLDNLLAIETPDSDKFIRRDKVYRNAFQIASAARHGENVLLDMLDPGLSLYPNPTSDCSWDCDFREVCIKMEDGSDWQSELDLNFESQPSMTINDSWRKRIVYPQGEVNA